MRPMINPFRPTAGASPAGRRPHEIGSGSCSNFTMAGH
ncbi:hypothetical protein SAMN04489738_1371 [Pseudarthrobacter chlorophenolicus]|nr:hypothetical protein SAMN04489738_1371 [Pseudarthrobacter chlorophenolicus]